MATEILAPQDVLMDRLSPALRRQRVYSNGGLGNKKEKAASKPDKKKIILSPENAATARKRAKNGSVVKEDLGVQMGKVMLLRRGESLDSLITKVNKSPQPKPVEADFDPEISLKPIRICTPDMYAGSAFYLSPSPRSLPLPSFFNQKKNQENPLTDSATEDLRRLLRLE